MRPILARDSSSGVTGALPYDPIQYCILAAGTAIAWAFAFELNLTALLTFRRRKSLYFWSLIICSWGCTLHALGFILKFLVGATWLCTLAFVVIGWVMMVTGQSFVLYSRLNLVVRSKLILRLVLAFIIIDGIAFHTPTLVFIYNANRPHPRWVDKFNTMERIQLMAFSFQESVISSIYIVATVRLLGAVYYTRTRQAMLQLLGINFICIAMDLILIGLEFSNYYVAEASVKPLIYAIKLKLEFAVYAQLRGFTKANFEDKERRATDTNSTDNLQGPTDFIRQIPKALKKPATISTPTIHTHPEQLLKRKNPMNITTEWDSSQVELSANTIAAALTASGNTRGLGGHTSIPRYPSDQQIPTHDNDSDATRVDHEPHSHHNSSSHNLHPQPHRTLSPSESRSRMLNPDSTSTSRNAGSKSTSRRRGISREKSDRSITLNTFGGPPKPRRGFSGEKVVRGEDSLRRGLSNESIPRTDYTPKTHARLSGGGTHAL